MLRKTYGGLECIEIYFQLCKDSPQCTKSGKNLKANASFNSTKPLPLLSGPNEELQLDYAGPLLDSYGNSIYILIAIDRYSKYPSAMITRSTGDGRLINFLNRIFNSIVFPNLSKLTNILVLRTN